MRISSLMLIAMLWTVPASAATPIPDADSPGGKLYAARCSACHALPHPKRLDWPRWRHMLGVMKQRMNERGMRMRDEEWRRIAAYLKSHAR